MTWEEFKKQYSFRDAEKCCINCKHGYPKHEGECDCNHPLLVDKQPLCGVPSFSVCDAWEAEGGAK